MSKMKAGIVVLLGLAVAGIGAIHWNQVQVSQKRMVALRTLAERRTVAAELITEMERYRRSSANFRKLGDVEASAAKDRLRTQFSQKLSYLETLDPVAEERTAVAKANELLSEFMLMSAKVEPLLYSRDFYSKQEARDLHDAILAELGKMSEVTKARETDLLEQAEAIGAKSFQLIALLAGVSFGMLMVVLTWDYFAWTRPSRRLRAIAEKYRHAGNIGSNEEAAEKPLSGVHGEVQSVLKELASIVQAQRLDRQRFITAVATELRPPLISLKSGVDMLGEPQLDADSRRQAEDVVRRSVVRLWSSFDDLTDLVEADQKHIKLDEKIVDLRGMLNTIGKFAAGNGLHEVRAAQLPNPVWVHLDPQRFERVMIHLLTKVASYSPTGGSIDLAVERRMDASFRGIEIQIREGQRANQGRSNATGPELDVLRHWVSESGYGIGLAQRIIQAHGGSITASGVTGTGIRFTVRLPSERVARAATVPAHAPSGAIEAFAFG